VAERRLPEFGSDKDFQLAQAIKQLKGQPVKASTTLAERKADKKD
jgi:carboxyl-terminal processing protease